MGEKEKEKEKTEIVEEKEVKEISMCGVTDSMRNWVANAKIMILETEDLDDNAKRLIDEANGWIEEKIKEEKVRSDGDNCRDDWQETLTVVEKIKLTESVD